MLFAGLCSDLIASHPYNLPSGRALEPPGSTHWLGTDDLGIDLWAMICHGAKISMTVGISTALLAGVGGSLLGILAGYYGGMVDKAVMRFADAVLVLPRLPAVIVLAAFFGPSLKNIVFALALFSWAVPARIIRSKILAVKEEAYIAAAQSYGAGLLHLTLKHFLPAVLPLVLASLVRLTGRAVTAEAGLSFLGLGDPTAKSWGLILNQAVNFEGIYFTDFWKWWVISPLAAITLLVVAIAFVGREFEKLVNAKI